MTFDDRRAFCRSASCDVLVGSVRASLVSRDGMVLESRWTALSNIS